MSLSRPKIFQPGIRNTLRSALLKANDEFCCWFVFSSVPKHLKAFPFFPGLLRRRERVDVTPKGDSAWLPPPGRDSPKLDISGVLHKQSEADLAGARPGTKNSSFRAQTGLGSPRRDPEDTSSSGLVTLASPESGFVTNDIYELCGDRVGRSQESTWVDNEIYGY